MLERHACSVTVSVVTDVSERHAFFVGRAVAGLASESGEFPYEQ